jgi:uncharacterized protein (DUF2237 family)
MKKSILLFLFVTTMTLGQNKEAKKNCLITKETTTSTLNKNKMKKQEKNVLGTALEMASLEPLTGFYRDGFCSTGSADAGIHVVAAVLTDEFLNYSKSKGNDLITPNLKYGFPGLKSGDVWCLCANRWKEALKAGVAPSVILKATNEKALDIISLDDLKLHVVK